MYICQIQIQSSSANLSYIQLPSSGVIKMYCLALWSCCSSPRQVVNEVTVTIYFINPSGKLKLSFDRTTKNISQ